MSKYPPQVISDEEIEVALKCPARGERCTSAPYCYVELCKKRITYHVSQQLA